MTRTLALLALLALTGCKTPGTLAIAIPSQDVRLDVAVAHVFRVPIDQRREMIQTLAVRSRTHGRDAGARGEVLVRDADFDAWVTEFEREFTRRDVRVIAHDEVEARARDADETQTARLLGADAVFQLNLLEVIEDRRAVDLRPHRLRRKVGKQVQELDAYWVNDFVCHVDAKLILRDGVVAWSGEVFVPASSLVQPDSLVLTYRVADRTDRGPQLLEPGSPEVPNPWIAVMWEPAVADLVPLASLPPGISSQSPELLRAVTKVAARRCVAEVFHADMPGGSPGF